MNRFISILNAAGFALLGLLIPALPMIPAQVRAQFVIDPSPFPGVSRFEAAQLALTPIVRWRMNESSGTSMVDDIGSNNATYAGTPVFGGAGVFGSNHPAVEFDGSTEYATVTPIAALDGLSGFSVEAFFKSSTTGAQQQIIRCQRGTAEPGFNLAVTSSGFGRISSDPSPSDSAALQDGDVDLFDGAWHHLVGILDIANDTLKLVVDGTVYTNTGAGWTTTTYDQGTPTEDTSIGATNVPNSYTDGQISYVTIYDSVLTTAQAQGLFTASGL